jgi:hypothetical protein
LRKLNHGGNSGKVLIIKNKEITLLWKSQRIAKKASYSLASLRIRSRPAGSRLKIMIRKGKKIKILVNSLFSIHFSPHITITQKGSSPLCVDILIKTNAILSSKSIYP